MTAKFGFLFPGQGSQAVGMMSAWEPYQASLKASFKEASDVLGYDLWALVQEGPEAQLNKTEFTQPALLAASVALWRLRAEMLDGEPFLMAGHSLGEYSALVAAQAITFKDAIALVALRGQLMQAAVPEGVGAMAAILGLDDIAVEAVCEEVSKDDAAVSPANYNAIGQVVIAGHVAAIDMAIDAAKQAGAKVAKRLSVSVPSHCYLMDSAAEKLEAHLASVNINTPKIPVIHNVDVDTHSHPDDIREILVRQLSQPVRWVESIQRLASEGVNTVYECGPGNILTKLNKRIDKNITSQLLGADHEPRK